MSAYLRTKDVAKALGVHPQTILNWARSGKLPHIKASDRVWLFDPEAIKAVLETQTTPAAS